MYPCTRCKPFHLTVTIFRTQLAWPIWPSLSQVFVVARNSVNNLVGKTQNFPPLTQGQGFQVVPLLHQGTFSKHASLEGHQVPHLDLCWRGLGSSSWRATCLARRKQNSRLKPRRKTSKWYVDMKTPLDGHVCDILSFSIPSYPFNLEVFRILSWPHYPIST